MHVLAALLLSAVAGTSATYSGLANSTTVLLPRQEATVTIDGRLDEPAWTSAALLTGFSQYAPADGRPADATTEVLVWYSPTAIYFGIKAHAEPGSVRATLANRDRIDSDDWVQIYLTTFNDGRQATMFGVNPLGVQTDGALVEGVRTSSGGGSGFGGLTAGRAAPDLSPDFVFESKGRLTDYGYEVELRIPFKSLRYQSSKDQQWGIHIIRRVQSSGHEDSWVPARRNASSFLGQSGSLTGLTDLRRGLVMDLNPFVTAHTDGEPAVDGWAYDTGIPDFGGNLRWGVTPNLTLNATVNPDFSQVESDASQFQFDPRQALFYPEKRPFFLDGIEFFSTPNNLVYSRRIVDPVVAAKLTGKISGASVAVLSAVDDDAQSASGHDYPVYNIVRLQHDIRASSRVGLVYTDRVEGDASNRVVGLDSRIVWRKIYSLDMQGAMSRDARAGTTLTAPLWSATVNRAGRRYGFRFSTSAVDDDFRPGSGFIGRTGVANVGLTNQLSAYGDRGALVERWTGDISTSGTWQYDDFVNAGPAQDRKIHFNNNFTLRGGWQTGFSVLVESYGYDERLYEDYALLDGDTLKPFVGVPSLPNLDYVVTLNTPRIHGLSGNVFCIWGRDENFYEWASANITFLTAGLQWRPTERLRLDGNYQLQSYERRTDDSIVAIRRIPRVKVEYQATRAIFFRWVGEYDAQYQDDLRDDSRTNLPIVFVDPATGTWTPALGSRRGSLRQDVLFSYQPNPGTVIFAGYGSTLGSDVSTDPRALRRATDGFFLKVSYLFRL
ncbi:MAG TPA: DUF5916 domain-containing protein [Vicinamibacterales bacterium]|jgi:hypothetical protein|nr:DUF5916 domain-containing protein [Vicinamibacterales bacterium]